MARRRFTGRDELKGERRDGSAEDRSTGHRPGRAPQGFGEALPVEDGWAAVIISNGVLKLMPDSAANFGTLGIRARKAVSDDEWQRALASLSCVAGGVA